MISSCSYSLNCGFESRRLLQLRNSHRDWLRWTRGGGGRGIRSISKVGTRSNRSILMEYSDFFVKKYTLVT